MGGGHPPIRTGFPQEFNFKNKIIKIKINENIPADADGWMVPAAAADTPPLVKDPQRTRVTLSFAI